MSHEKASASSEDIASLTLSMAKSMSLLTQRNFIQYATTPIPVFDGENPPLSVFAQSVENGLALIPPNTETEFLTIVLTKLTGPARISIQDKKFSTVTELLGYLKKRYAPGRNLAYFQGEIARLKIRSDESLRKYIDRVSRLAHCTRTAVRDRYGENSAEILKELEKDILENFIEGLPEKVALKLTLFGANQKTLEDAFEAVIQVDRRLRNRRYSSDVSHNNDYGYNEEYRGRRRSRERDHSPRPSYYHSPSRRNYFRDKSTSGSETEYEHRPRREAAMTVRRSTSRSPSYSSDSSRKEDYPRRNDTNKTNNKSQLYCWNCGIKGHDAKTCNDEEESRYKRFPSSRPSSYRKDLNSECAHRKGDPVSVLKNDRQKKIRFSDEKESNPSEKHQPRESESRFRSWKKDRENSY